MILGECFVLLGTCLLLGMFVCGTKLGLHTGADFNWSSVSQFNYREAHKDTTSHCVYNTVKDEAAFSAVLMSLAYSFTTT